MSARRRDDEHASSEGLVLRARPAVERVVRRVLGTGHREHEDVVQTSLERWLAWLDREAIRDEHRVVQFASVMAKHVAIDASCMRIDAN